MSVAYVKATKPGQTVEFLFFLWLFSPAGLFCEHFSCR